MSNNVDTAKLLNLAWQFEANSTPPADFDASALNDYDKAFYDVLKNSEQMLANAGFTLPDVGGNSNVNVSGNSSNESSTLFI